MAVLMSSRRLRAAAAARLCEAFSVRRLTSAVLAAAAILPAAFAASAPAAAQQPPALLSVGGGYYDAFAQDNQAADFRLEYRHDEGFWLLKPWAGVEATTDGAVYGAGGVYFDLPLTERLIATASFGAGAYHDGDGKDLGHSLMFRSQLELGYRFQNQHRLSLAVSHLSNADIGDTNPGTEVVSLYYHIPIAQLLPR